MQLPAPQSTFEFHRSLAELKAQSRVYVVCQETVLVTVNSSFSSNSSCVYYRFDLPLTQTQGVKGMYTHWKPQSVMGKLLSENCLDIQNIISIIPPSEPLLYRCYIQLIIIQLNVFCCCHSEG